MGNQKLSKKAIVLAQQKRKKTVQTIIASVAAAAVLIVGITWFATAQREKKSGQASPLSTIATLGGSSRQTVKAADHRTIKPEDGVIRLAAADFNGGEAIYYSTKAGGKTVKFFVMQSTDGVIRAAFDACDVCYQAKRGYRQEGSIMVCNNCGQQFPSHRINEERGGCNPSPLERHHENGEVLIKIADVEKGAIYF